jgi:hypothetical protein
LKRVELEAFAQDLGMTFDELVLEAVQLALGKAALGRNRLVRTQHANFTSQKLLHFCYTAFLEACG